MILCLGVLEAKKQVGGGRKDSHDGHCGKRRCTDLMILVPRFIFVKWQLQETRIIL